MKMILCSLLKNSGHTLGPILSLAETIHLETMHLDNRFRTKSSEKAELFNFQLYEQFSGPSILSTHISWSIGI